MLRWRLTDSQRQAFGDKFLDLANYAAAAMVFGQFVGDQRFSWRVMAAGVVIWFLFAGAAFVFHGGR
jgi:hypothetical protein